MPSRSLVRRSPLAAPLLAALLAVAAAGSARADEPPKTSDPSEKTAPAAADDRPDPKTARPPPLGELDRKPLPWDHLFDIGGDFAVVSRPASVDIQGRASSIRYQAATGFALHLRFPIIEHLAIEGYFLDVHMPVEIPLGGLGVRDAVTSPPVETFVFGARVSPWMKWGRLTAFLTIGAGWGRFEFQRMTARAPSGATYTIRERGGSFVEIPFGLGASVEIIRRWLTLDLTGTAAFAAEQHGDAFDEGQTVDAAGRLHTLRGLPVMDASIVGTLGFSILL